MINLVLSGIAVIGVIIATFTDLRSNIIPNNLTYSMILMGVLLHLGFYLYRGGLFRAFYGILGGSIAFGIGLLLYIIGGWAGGDVKLLAALGALLPTSSSPIFSTSGTTLFSRFPLFPLTIILNGLIIVAPFIIAYMIWCFAKGEGITSTDISISELKPGSVPAEAIWEESGDIKKGGSLPQNYDKCYLNPRRLEEIDEKQLEKLQKFYEQGRIRAVKIRRIFPFAPVIAAGTISGMLLGNIYWVLIFL